jgi:aminopeptidase YwaD
MAARIGFATHRRPDAAILERPSTMPRWTHPLAAGTLALVVTLAGACAGGSPRSAAPPAASAGPGSPLADWAVRDALRRAGPDAAEALGHVAFLASDHLEGRAPDTSGDELAASYIERRLRGLGLEPAFPDVGGRRVAYAQPFGVRGGIEIERAALAAAPGSGAPVALELGGEFTPAGFSASASVEGPAVFVGYAIERGERGYRGFADGASLDGAVAVALRYEPMDGRGASVWAREGEWSRRASLESKVRALRERGASGLVVIDAVGPGGRAGMLPDHRATDMRIDAPFPVVFVSEPAGERLVGALSPGGAGLGALRAEANERGVVRRLDGTLAIDVALDREDVGTANVGAILPGRGALAGQTLVIGAHYDHIGRGYYHARDPENLGAIHPGADDNASGVAGLLLLARWLSERYARLPEDTPARSVLFLAFSAEELGLLGATHFASGTALGADDVAAMLNLDMIGRLEREGGVWALGAGTAPEFEPLLRRVAGEMGLTLTIRRTGAGASDHAVFYHSGIPSLHFFTGPHDDYHTVRDTFDTLNYAGLVRVARLVERVALELATAPTQPEFTVPREPGPR